MHCTRPHKLPAFIHIDIHINLPTYLPTQVNLELSIYNIVNHNRLIKKVIEYLGGLVNKIFVVLSLMCKRQRVVPQRYEMSSHLTSSHVEGNFVFINLFIGFPCMESLLTEVYGLCIFFLQLVLLVSMVTNARRIVNVNFLTWIKNVILEMESVTVSLDSPVNTVIKVCRIYYNQIRSYVTFQV